MRSTASVVLDTQIVTQLTYISILSNCDDHLFPRSQCPNRNCIHFFRRDIAQYQAEYPEFLPVAPSLDAADEAHEEITVFVEASSERRVMPQEFYASSAMMEDSI